MLWGAGRNLMRTIYKAMMRTVSHDGCLRYGWAAAKAVRSLPVDQFVATPTTLWSFLLYTGPNQTKWTLGPIQRPQTIMKHVLYYKYEPSSFSLQPVFCKQIVGPCWQHDRMQGFFFWQF